MLQRLNERSSPEDPYSSVTTSFPITPATDEFARATPATEAESVVVSAADLKKLQAELHEARSEVARIGQELHSSHVAKSTVDHLGQGSEADYNYNEDVTEQTLTQLQKNFAAANRGGYGWGNDTRSFYNGAPQQQSFGINQPQAPSRPVLAQSGYQGRTSYLNEPTHFPLNGGFRGGRGTSNPPSRPASAFEAHPYNQYMSAAHHYAAAPMPDPVGSGLSPEASEFNTGNAFMGPSPWNSQVRLSSLRFYSSLL